MTGVRPSAGCVLDVMLLLVRADGAGAGAGAGAAVLLGLREGTGYADGLWNPPSGKVEPGEDALAALAREAREEVGLRLRTEDARLVATVHHHGGAAGRDRLGLFFEVRHRPELHGVPVNAEPHKCARIGWFGWDALPDDLEPYNATGIDLYRRGRPFGTYAWG